MYGWKGKILKIDLSKGKHFQINLDQDIYLNWLGGRGLAGYFLRDYIHLNWDSPDMPLCLFTGPLVGTSSPASGRMTIMSRSPLTGTIGDSSVGGSLGINIKRAGWDGFIITGKNKNLCGIEIIDDSINIVSAAHMAFWKTSKIFNQLRKKGSIAAIGPAAENGVAFSNIMIDSHFAAGRNGLGLIFAAKNIKYILVKGNGKNQVKDLQALKKASEDVLRLVSSSPVLLGEHGISKFGTGALYDLISVRKMIPTDNFRNTFFTNFSSMNAWSFKKKYNPHSKGCKGCNILCKKLFKPDKINPSQNNCEIPIPEYETMAHFSALINNNDIDIVTKANQICNDMGMDTISAASTIACFQEACKMNLKSENVLSMLDQIGQGIGIGRELASGSFNYAQKIGKPQISMSVKGQDLPAYDPRGSYSMALAYVTSTRGGCHLRAYPISHEILRKPVATDRFSYSGKARIVKIAEDMFCIADSLTICKFALLAASLEEYSVIFKAVTNVDYSNQDLMKIGEKIFYNEKIMNAVNGFDIKDDDLPDRFFSQDGFCDNETSIKAIDKNEFYKLRSNYYKIRGLDENGIPLAKKAEELGLDWKN